MVQISHIGDGHMLYQSYENGRLESAIFKLSEVSMAVKVGIAAMLGNF